MGKSGRNRQEFMTFQTCAWAGFRLVVNTGLTVFLVLYKFSMVLSTAVNFVMKKVFKAFKIDTNKGSFSTFQNFQGLNLTLLYSFTVNSK